MSIALDHDTFHVSVKGFRDDADQLAERRRRIDLQVDGLLGSEWSGVAAASFGEAWSDWRRAADVVLARLGALADTLDATHDDLTHRDLDASAAVGVVAVRLHERLG